MAVSSPAEARKPLGRREQRLPAAHRARVRAAFPGRIERIVLFGSHARGQGHSESDRDFAVF